MRIPQANDIAKLEDIPLAIKKGASSAPDIAQRYQIVLREAQYYLEASAMLGFIQRAGHQYSLSALGTRYVALQHPEKKALFMRQMLALPIIQEIIVDLILGRKHRLTFSELRSIVSEKGRLSGSTTGRRSQTLLKWFGWLGEETGVFTMVGNSIWLKTTT